MNFFKTKFFLSAIAIVVLVICTFAAFSNIKYLDESIKKQYDYMTSSLGTVAADHIWDNANDWYKNLKVNKVVREFLIPAEQSVDGSKAKQNQKRTTDDTTRELVVRICQVSYFILLHLAIVSSCAIFLIAYSVVVLYDGYQQRQIKKTNFQLTNPTIRNYASVGASALLLLFVILLILPIPVPPLAFVLSAMASATLYGLAVSNISKHF